LDVLHLSFNFISDFQFSFCSKDFINIREVRLYFVKFLKSSLRTYAQYDLAALVSVQDIDETMTDALASVDKSMYASVASRELATIPTENIFHTDGSMIDDVTGLVGHNINYETGH
jgi:hypothetical protein